MLTEDTVNAFMIIESVSGQESDKLNAALDGTGRIDRKGTGRPLFKSTFFLIITKEVVIG